MVQLTRIYTKGGDKGKTSLGDGTRVSKGDARIEAIGAVDECNSALGVVICALDASDLVKLLRHIQNDLFDLGADLCIPQAGHTADLRIHDNQVQYLEQKIDHYNADLAPLQSFILPGGTMAAAHMHVARAAARRAERMVILLADSGGAVHEPVKRYINRLSDLLFVLARVINGAAGDVLWVPGANRHKEFS